MFKNILVPTDGSELAVKAVEQSVLFAKEAGAKITGAVWDVVGIDDGVVSGW